MQGHSWFNNAPEDDASAASNIIETMPNYIVLVWQVRRGTYDAAALEGIGCNVRRRTLRFLRRLYAGIEVGKFTDATE